jgi:hypothetical protein
LSSLVVRDREKCSKLGEIEPEETSKDAVEEQLVDDEEGVGDKFGQGDLYNSFGDKGLDGCGGIGKRNL